MDVGLAYFPTHYALEPAALARLLEERGHRWLQFAEHTHIPASRDTPWGGVEGAPELPRKYAHTYDPFVALAQVFAVTTHLRAGTGICLVTERDPIVTAKVVASLDHLSGGRFEFGVGAGWNREELLNHGTDPRRRFKVMRERILAMQAIWTQHEATFHGEFVNFDRIWCDPKPLQKPYPPILVGGDGPTVFDRVLEYGDAWMPIHNREVVGRIAELHQRAGRRVPVIVNSPPLKAKVLESYREAGVERVFFWLPSTGRGPIEQALEQIEATMAELNGAD
jgi:probable F420-dependent oxidoreductase